MKCRSKKARLCSSEGIVNRRFQPDKLIADFRLSVRLQTSESPTLTRHFPIVLCHMRCCATRSTACMHTTFNTCGED
jgi:hypothetical protein